MAGRKPDYRLMFVAQPSPFTHASIGGWIFPTLYRYPPLCVDLLLATT